MNTYEQLLEKDKKIKEREKAYQKSDKYKAYQKAYYEKNFKILNKNDIT